MFSVDKKIRKKFLNKCNNYTYIFLILFLFNLKLFLIAMSTYHWEEDAEHKKKMKDGAFKKMAFILDKLEEQVKKNGGYLVRGKVKIIYYLVTA